VLIWLCATSGYAPDAGDCPPADLGCEGPGKVVSHARTSLEAGEAHLEVARALSSLRKLTSGEIMFVNCRGRVRLVRLKGGISGMRMCLEILLDMPEAHGSKANYQG